MKITVIGLGYVGAVSAACLAETGADVIGVDVDRHKVDAINGGESPVLEDGLPEIIEKNVKGGRLRATVSLVEGMSGSDISLVCVGTPSGEDGGVSLDQVAKVLGEIGKLLKDHEGYHLIVLRSTVPPAAWKDILTPIIEKESGKKLGDGWGFSQNPEFLREGSGVKDFFEPELVVAGVTDETGEKILRKLYSTIDAPFVVVDPDTAAMVKYACNTFHAAKITFANEMGKICKKFGVDSHRVMDIVCQDTRLNISRAYMRPGFAFGGSCLPKDLRAILKEGASRGAVTPMLENLLPSNESVIDTVAGRVSDSGADDDVLLIGLSFKPNTDDLRESPMVALASRLKSKGVKFSVYDPNVSPARLIGANRKYIESILPGIDGLMTDDLKMAAGRSGVIVVAAAYVGVEEVLSSLDESCLVIDLARVYQGAPSIKARYDGLWW